MTGHDDARRLRWLGYGCAFLVGVVFVLSIFPTDVLLGTALPDDRFGGDAATHATGQRAFLQDRWHWPLLKTTMLDWPVGLNIAMTDSNPLVMLPLKLFARLLPPSFSAIQLWLAFAYLMQPIAAVFALRSAGEPRLIPAVAVALIAVSMPTFLFRHEHSALSSHFLILLAIGTYFRTMRGLAGRVWLPPVLQLGSFLIHPYLSFMVAALHLAAPLSLICRGNPRWRGALLPVLGGLALTAAAAALLGYGAESPNGGFGLASMNVLSPFYPSYPDISGDPKRFVDATGGQYEGYQFLGLGVLGLIVLSAVHVGRVGVATSAKRNVGLLLSCLALTGLALSNLVYVGRYLLLDFGPPPAIFQQLRASGRLFWPVGYLLVVGGVVLLRRNARPAIASTILLVVAAVQVAEASGLRHTVALGLRRTVAQPLDAAYLDALLAHHRHVTVLPTWGCGLDMTQPALTQLKLAASSRRVTLNTIDTARFTGSLHCDDVTTAMRALDPDELRVFAAPAENTGAFAVPGGSDHCRKLGPLAICSLGADLRALPPVVAPQLEPNELVRTTAPPSSPLLGLGWYRPEIAGTWSVGGSALVTMRSDDLPPKGATLDLALYGYTAGGPPSVVDVLLDGKQVATWQLTPWDTMEHLDIRPKVDPITLEFRVRKPLRPSDHGMAGDVRELGIFIQSVKLTPN